MYLHVRRIKTDIFLAADPVIALLEMVGHVICLSRRFVDIYNASLLVNRLKLNRNQYRGISDEDCYTCLAALSSKCPPSSILEEGNS